MNNAFSKEKFIKLVKDTAGRDDLDFDYLYDLYRQIFDGIREIDEESHILANQEINSLSVSFYLLGEYLYSCGSLNEESLKKFKENEKVAHSICSVVADKYLSLSIYNHDEDKLTNKFFPPISTIDLYLNLMSNIISSYERNDPKKTLIVDLLNKSISISRCIITLLCDGYETEALSMWRTLHECECTLILLDKYGDTAINAYLKHMNYGLAYKDALPDKTKQDEIFYQMKDEMSKFDLKSKDIKKYIEYGWLYSISDYKTIENFKLNFRDGLETLAGLHKYSNIYMTSSEILHSTPLLIYSNKRYFYFMALLNLYESFFRIEKVFSSLFFSRVSVEGKNRYLEMRKLYYSQLLSIHQRELLNFRAKANKKEA